MDQELNNKEERFFDLIESKDFAALSLEEQLLVQEFCSPEDYQLQRRMIQEAPHLFDTDMAPTPLIIEEKTSVLPFWKRPIPLYQALTGVAATVALFFAIWPSHEDASSERYTKKGEQTARIDTVYQTKIIRDTVIRSLKKSTVKQSDMLSIASTFHEQPRMIEASGSVSIPKVTLSEITPTGRTMKDDPSARLVIATTFQHTDR